MLLKEHFQETIARLGLDDLESEQERQLAEIIWHRCEAAFMQSSPQTAALLKPRSYGYFTKTERLTLQEVQFLNQLFAEMLTISSYNLSGLKEGIQECWLLCDPDDSKTKENFDILNKLRTKQRKYKKLHKQLATIQHKLKKSRT